MDKVLLILVDGMRPDSIAACGSEYADNMLKNCRYKDMQASLFLQRTSRLTVL